MNALTSGLRWTAYWLFLALWYPPLIALSYLVPMSRLHTPARRIFRLSMRVLGMRIVVRGLEHLDLSRGYIYVGNHVNMFDPFVFVSAVPQWVVNVEKRPNFKIPFYGLLIARWGNIPIDRDNPIAAARTLMGLAPRLREGGSIALSPEGRRTRDGELGEFKQGPFRLAIMAQAQIVPYVLRNMRYFNETGSLRLRPATVEIIFTPPIDPSPYTKATLDDLSARVRGQMVEALAEVEPVA